MCSPSPSWCNNTTPYVSLRQGVACAHAKPSRDRSLPATRQATSQRMLALDRATRHQRRIREVPTQPRPTQGHGPSLGIRGVRRSHSRWAPDRSQVPLRGRVLPRWTRVSAPSMRQPSPPRSSHRICEHHEATALRACPYRMPQGPPVQRRQPHQRERWSPPLPGVRQG